MKPRILVVDDEPDICKSVREILEDEGFEVCVAASVAAANKQVASHVFDLVLLDIWMAPQDGISLLRDWKEHEQMHTPVVMMSGHGTVETAVEATQLGARGFIEKPLTIAKLLQAVRSNLRPDIARTRRQGTMVVRELAGSSAIVKHLREDIARCAGGDRHVLIRGEYGTGKQFIAENIHSRSTRHTAPFVVMTATASVAAMIERAARGTLFIDCEKALHDLALCIGEHFNKHGCGCHVIFTTQELAPTSLVTQLETLLRSVTITAPPLRTYAEDIPEIVRASIDWHSQRDRHLPYRKFSIAAQNYLLHYKWPENLIELDRCVYRLLKEGTAEEVSLAAVKTMLGVTPPENTWFEQALQKPMRKARAMFERVYLQQLLDQAEGSVARLAEKTGMERTHLYRKLRMLGIPYKESRKHR